MMDSKRLFIFIALWLILSCVLLDHAKGFIQPRKMRKYKQRKRDPKNHLGRNTKELIALVSQIWVRMYQLNMIYSYFEKGCRENYDLLPKGDMGYD